MSNILICKYCGKSFNIKQFGNHVLKEKMAMERGYKVIRFWESDLKKDISIIINCLK